MSINREREGLSPLLTEDDLAARWQVSPKTLQAARSQGRLVQFLKIGRTVRYRVADVIAFESARAVPHPALPPMASGGAKAPRSQAYSSRNATEIPAAQPRPKPEVSK